MTTSPLTTLLLDIGGIILTNGWDRQMRRKAAEHFDLDYEEMDERHHLTFDTYEEGKLTLDEYLTRVVFYRERPYTREDFKSFMFAQSQPYSQMIDYFSGLKARHHLRIGTVSNEGRELTTHRIEKFGLKSFVDFFISSCFVHIRKPDKDLFRMALDISQAQPEEAVYIDDREMFVEVAATLGIHGIHHVHFELTKAALTSLGLPLE